MPCFVLVPSKCSPGLNAKVARSEVQHVPHQCCKVGGSAFAAPMLPGQESSMCRTDVVRSQVQHVPQQCCQSEVQHVPYTACAAFFLPSVYASGYWGIRFITLTPTRPYLLLLNNMMKGCLLPLEELPSSLHLWWYYLTCGVVSICTRSTAPQCTRV
jgi:hypothetical protein